MSYTGGGVLIGQMKTRREEETVLVWIWALVYLYEWAANPYMCRVRGLALACV